MAAAAAWDGRIDIEESTALFGIRGGLKAKGILDAIAMETMELVQRKLCGYPDPKAGDWGVLSAGDASGIRRHRIRIWEENGYGFKRRDDAGTDR